MTDQAPHCQHADHSEMVRNIHPMEFQYKDQSITLDQPAWYCPMCDESVLSVADALITEPAFQDFVAVVDGSLPAPEVQADLDEAQAPSG